MNTTIPSDVRAVIRRHAAIFDTKRQAVIGTTLDGYIVYWSPVAEKVYGWKADEVDGKPVLDVTPAPSSRGQAEAIMERLKLGRSWSGEFMVQSRSGERIAVLVRDVPVKDDDGKLVGIIGISSPR